MEIKDFFVKRYINKSAKKMGLKIADIKIVSQEERKISPNLFKIKEVIKEAFFSKNTHIQKGVVEQIFRLDPEEFLEEIKKDYKKNLDLLPSELSDFRGCLASLISSYSSVEETNRILKDEKWDIFLDYTNEGVIS